MTHNVPARLLAFSSTPTAIKYRVATAHDAAALAPNLRAADLAELALLHPGVDPASILEQSLAISYEAWAILQGEEVVGLAGISSCIDEPADTPWMMLSETARPWTTRLVTDARAWLNNVRRPGVALIGFVSKTNVGSIKWLRAVGFQVAAEMPTSSGAPAGLLIYFQRATDV